ncbi:MAG TPA: plastocyanin/azurin family copper-binding protein [Gaiellaceae bacterium]|jgi:heme/copper-type cytochrome/quinol oxidase subunit 2|nr:plastocyanin/azurin family copper-binding protein [Gaiellaceae bacterium]
MAAHESPVAAPAPGWGRRIPRDERVFLWLVGVSLVVMTAVVFAWLAWGEQNVPATYRYLTPAEFAKQVTAFVDRHRGADGRVYVPAGEDAYLAASRYAFYPELVLQANTRYRIWLSATDTLHGFSLVGGGQNINLELAPNHVTGLNLTVGDPGRYLVVCNEYCGLQHHEMKTFLTVVPAAEMAERQAAQAGGSEAAPAPGGAGTLELSADPSGALAFDTRTLRAEAGKVTIAMRNPSPLPHNVAIKGNGVDVVGKVVLQGGTSIVTAELRPGTYTFYCSVPGHEEAGMKGTLTVP